MRQVYLAVAGVVGISCMLSPFTCMPGIFGIESLDGEVFGVWGIESVCDGAEMAASGAAAFAGCIGD
jgi:hypothetical protein